MSTIPEGTVSFWAQHTPSKDLPFDSVTLTAHMNQVGGNGSASISTQYSVEKAREYAATINRACDIVEADQMRDAPNRLRRRGIIPPEHDVDGSKAAAMEARLAHA